VSFWSRLWPKPAPVAAHDAPRDPRFEQGIAQAQKPRSRSLHVTNAIIYLDRVAQFEATETALQTARQHGKSIVCLLNVGHRSHAVTLFAERLKLDPTFRDAHQIRDFMPPTDVWSRGGDRFAQTLAKQIKLERLEETSDGETFLFRPPPTRIVAQDGTLAPVTRSVTDFLTEASQFSLHPDCVVLIPLTFEDDAKGVQVRDWFAELETHAGINRDNLLLQRLAPPEPITTNEVGLWAQQVSEIVYPRAAREHGLNEDREDLRMMLLRTLDCDVAFPDGQDGTQPLRALKTYFEAAIGKNM